MLTQHGSPCWPHGLGPQDGILHKLTPGRRAQVGAYELGPGPTSSGRGVREGLLIDYLMLGALLAHVPTSGGPVALSAVQATLLAPGGLHRRGSQLPRSLPLQQSLHPARHADGSSVLSTRRTCLHGATCAASAWVICNACEESKLRTGYDEHVWDHAQ